MQGKMPMMDEALRKIRRYYTALKNYIKYGQTMTKTARQSGQDSNLQSPLLGFAPRQLPTKSCGTFAAASLMKNLLRNYIKYD